MKTSIQRLRHMMREAIDASPSQRLGHDVALGGSMQQSFADPSSSLLHALACLRLAYLSHQNSHWQARGEPFYADHQLYARLYESAAKDVDSLAERIAGLFGGDTIDLGDQVQSLLACQECTLVMAEAGALERAVAVEEHALECIEDAYDTAATSGTKTLGLDDLLMQIASSREEAMYLLRQRTG